MEIKHLRWKKIDVSLVTMVRFRMKVAKSIQRAYPIHCQVLDPPGSCCMIEDLSQKRNIVHESLFSIEWKNNW